MFLEHFGLIEQPFGVTPDPRFLHLGPRHREALASLVYGTEANRGFLALIAKPGMGKTSLLYQYLEGQRDKARTAFLFQTDCEPRELLRYLLADLGLDIRGKDLPALHNALNEELVKEMRAGRRFILVVDEAQNLEEKALEFVRLLSNFETPWVKLMQIVIAGQPQLAERLARPSMAQLRQRVSSIIRLDPLTPEETNAYINHRLWVAGYQGPSLFTIGARLLIAEQSGGIPRKINNLCFNTLSLAYAMGTTQVNSKIVREAMEDLDIESMLPEPEHSQRAPDSRRVFVPFASMLPVKKRRRVWQVAPSLVSACAVAFLGIASGISWQSGARTPPLDALHAAEAKVRLSRIAPAHSQDGPHAGQVAPVEASSPPIASNGVYMNQPIRIVVEPGETLRQLSLRYIGRFDTSVLVEVCSLNPEVKDPGHIEAGQVLRLPVYLRHRDAAHTETIAGIPAIGGREKKP